jgi:inner membrane protein
MHSLFVAVVAGLIAAVLHKRLKVRPLTAGVVIAAAMASHGILDMMTNAGRPVAYLWPLSSVRLYADWRPIQVPSVHLAHLFTQAVVRLHSEFWQLILPMFVAAGAIRGARAAVPAIR